MRKSLCVHVKNVAVLRFFCAVSGWKNQVPTFFKARQEKGSLSPACEWFPQTKALVRSNEDGKAQKVRIYAAYRVSQLSNKNKERKVNEMTEEKRLERLRKPKGRVDVVLDTDMYNEIDDQFALAYLLRSEEKLDLQAVYAAPFFNHRSTSPADGMEKSYEEIHKVLRLMEKQEYCGRVLKGSSRYLPSEEEPEDSPAARDLVARVMERNDDNPLYVVAIGAITNIASAILMEPGIIEKMVVVWLGGNAREWKDDREFNALQDVAADRVVFGSGVPVVQLPCMGVVSAFSTTGPELEYWLRGKNKLCDYLIDNTLEEVQLCGQSGCWSRVIWDVTAVAWLLDESFMEERYEHRPIPQYDHKWSVDRTGHFIKYVYGINRDRIFADLFQKLSK